MDLSLEAIGLWAVAGSWCAKYLTDGYVPEKTIRRLGGGPDVSGELADAGLWEPAAGGWQFKDWADYQPTKEEVEAERDAARERMKRVRAAKKGVKRSDEQPPNVPENFEGSSEEVRSAPTHTSPIPNPSSSNEEEESARKRASTIPSSFAITDGMRRWAKTEVPLVDIDAKLPEFIDYWTGVGKPMKNWEAVWRNGMRKQQGFAERDSRGRTSRDDQNLAVVAQLAARAQGEQRGIGA